MSDEAIVTGSVEQAPPVVEATAPSEQKPVETGTLASGADSGKDVAIQADWPEDWREKLAGEDEKLLSRLKRFSSPMNVMRSWREAETKLLSGRVRTEIAADADEAAVTAWRKENGIPETADGYSTDIGNGWVWSDADQAMLKDFTEFAHGKNMPPEQVKANLEWYAQVQQRAAAAQNEADADFMARAESDLKEEWGAEFKRNQTAIGNLLDTMPKEVGDALMGARLPDGSIAGNNPGVLRQLARIARELNPAATLVPSGSNPAKGVADRLREIETRMRDDRAGYFRDAAMQQEYRELLEARERLGSRAA